MTDYDYCVKCDRHFSLEQPYPCDHCPFCGSPISEEAILQDLNKNYKSMRVDDIQ